MPPPTKSRKQRVLPPNWQTATDVEGDTYYRHVQTGETRCEFPGPIEGVKPPGGSGSTFSRIIMPTPAPETGRRAPTLTTSSQAGSSGGGGLNRQAPERPATAPPSSLGSADALASCSAAPTAELKRQGLSSERHEELARWATYRMNEQAKFAAIRADRVTRRREVAERRAADRRDVEEVQAQRKASTSEQRAAELARWELYRAHEQAFFRQVRGVVVDEQQLWQRERQRRMEEREERRQRTVALRDERQRRQATGGAHDWRRQAAIDAARQQEHARRAQSRQQQAEEQAEAKARVERTRAERQAVRADLLENGYILVGPAAEKPVAVRKPRPRLGRPHTAVPPTDPVLW